jgi:hypothetical protein
MNLDSSSALGGDLTTSNTDSSTEASVMGVQSGADFNQGDNTSNQGSDGTSTVNLQSVDLTVTVLNLGTAAESSGNGAIATTHPAPLRRGDFSPKDLFLEEECLVAELGGAGGVKERNPAGAPDSSMWVGTSKEDSLVLTHAERGTTDRELFASFLTPDGQSIPTYAGGWEDSGAAGEFADLGDTDADFSGSDFLVPSTGPVLNGESDLADYVPQGAAPLEIALRNFLEQVEDLGRELGAVVRGSGLAAWLAVLGTVGVTLELTRRRRRRLGGRLGLAGGAGDVMLSWVTGLPGPFAHGEP